MSVDWPNIPLPPCPPSVFVSLSPLLGTWLFWPQTGPGLSVPLRLIVSFCPLPFWSCSTPLCLRLLTEGVTTLPPPFIDLSFFSLSCLLVCWVRLSFRVIGLCSFVSLAFFCSACFLLSLSLSLLALSSVLRYPWVLCLVFLAADWSGFPAPPSLPPFFSSASLPWRGLLIFRHSTLFQCGTSGRRLVRGVTPLVPHYPSNSALSLAADWSRGCCVVILIHGTPY